MTTNVEGRNLSLHYRKHTALQDVSFTLTDGKIYGLLGRNGAGKTSLLSILASFREQTDGIITINGEKPFENTQLMQQVTFIYPKDYKEDSESLKTKFESSKRYRLHFDSEYALYLAERFKLPLDKPIKQFSKGMQAAVGAILGLANRSPITIFDEVYLGMDAPTREIFYQELLNDQGDHPRIIILSTHLVSEMEYLFDAILILHKGKLLLQEEYESLITKGASITGAAEVVDEFVRNMKKLNVQKLGNTKLVMVYGELSDAERQIAQEKELEVGPISLQDLFIHLTEEEA
ncbi:MAG: ABC transporter ATP-binding protein [Bacillus sp. (in: firmicutes)]